MEVPFLTLVQQLWPQFKLVDGAVCCQYCPGPLQELITVPGLPHTLQHNTLVRAHDIPARARKDLT